MASFKCADIGFRCGFEAYVNDEDELTKKISAHLSSVHKIKALNPELVAKIKKAIKAEPMIW